MSGDSRRPETSDFHIVEIVIDADGGEAGKDGMIKRNVILASKFAMRTNLGGNKQTDSWSEIGMVLLADV